MQPCMSLSGAFSSIPRRLLGHCVWEPPFDGPALAFKPLTSAFSWNGFQMRSSPKHQCRDGPKSTLMLSGPRLDRPRGSRNKHRGSAASACHFERQTPTEIKPHGIGPVDPRSRKPARPAYTAQYLVETTGSPL
jgi:hypothetical protein